MRLLSLTENVVAKNDTFLATANGNAQSRCGPFRSTRHHPLTHIITSHLTPNRARAHEHTTETCKRTSN